MEDKKLVSYCLFAYNQEKYIKEAVLGALSQTYTPLEIIISDDFSTDKTFAIIEELVRGYKGPHRVIINKNKKNLGIGAHFSQVCYGISAGDYIVVAAGDDISFDNHVEYAVDSIIKYSQVKMIDFNADIIDENGAIVKKCSPVFRYVHYTVNDYLNTQPVHSFAPGRIIKRELLDSFNPISDKCPTEDSVLVVRSLLLGGFVKLNQPLLFYRKHNSNFSNADNLARISNSSIISQYLNDITQLYGNGGLSEGLFDELLSRIILEKKIRSAKYSMSKNKLERKYKNIFVKFLIRKYIIFKIFRKLYS